MLTVLGTFLKSQKINFQQKQQNWPNRKNQLPQNTKKSPIRKWQIDR